MKLFCFKKASSFGSLPKKILRLSAESLLPPGAKISFLYFMPISGFISPFSSNLAKRSHE